MNIVEQLKANKGKYVRISVEGGGVEQWHAGRVYDVLEGDNVVILRSRVLFWEFEELIRLPKITAVVSRVNYVA